MKKVLGRIQSEFEAFVEPFETGAEEDRENVRLKREHSLRVWDNARLIIQDESLPPDVDLAVQAAALLHDAGRFPQYAQYKTFNDRQSENHARLGVRTILRQGLAAGLPSSVRRVVLGAVFLHNVRSLPPRLPRLLDYTVRVVRDADKLDILRVLLGYFDPEIPYNPVVLLGLPPHPENYTPEVLDAVLRGESADYTKMAWVNDFKLLLLSWSFSLNFAAARRAMLQRGLLRQLERRLPQGPQFAAAAEKAHNALENPSNTVEAPQLT